MTIRPLAFANTLAITTAVLALVLILLRIFFPPLFVFIFNAQFFGADVASPEAKRADATVPPRAAHTGAVVARTICATAALYFSHA